MLHPSLLAATVERASEDDSDVDMWQMRQYACGHPRPAIRAAVMPPGHAVGTTYAMELLKATVLLAPPLAVQLATVEHTSSTHEHEHLAGMGNLHRLEFTAQKGGSFRICGAPRDRQR